MAGAGIVTVYPDRLAEDGSTPAAPSAGAEQISVALCQASTPQAGSTRHSRAGCSSATSESASCWPTRRAIARSSGSSGSLASRRTLRRWWLRPPWPTQCATRRASFSGPGRADAHRRGGRRCRARRAPPRRRRIACTGHPDVHDVGGYRCSRRARSPCAPGEIGLSWFLRGGGEAARRAEGRTSGFVRGESLDPRRWACRSDRDARAPRATPWSESAALTRVADWLGDWGAVRLGARPARWRAGTPPVRREKSGQKFCGSGTRSSRMGVQS